MRLKILFDYDIKNERKFVEAEENNRKRGEKLQETIDQVLRNNQREKSDLQN